MNNDQLREALVVAFKNRTEAPFRIPVDFSIEELQDAEALCNLEDFVIKKILLQLRPDHSNMDRAEIECLYGNIPDSFLNAIESIKIETSISEATMAPQNIVCLYIKANWWKNRINTKEQ